MFGHSARVAKWGIEKRFGTLAAGTTIASYYIICNYGYIVELCS
jgi:hypothetical protein